MLKVYEYDRCSTCRKALKFLDLKKIPYERIPIVEQPPSRAEIARMIKLVGGEFRRLFNASGEVYRKLKLSTRIKTLSEADAISLLAGNGKLIRRPFVLSSPASQSPEIGLVGFDEELWTRTWPTSRA